MMSSRCIAVDSSGAPAPSRAAPVTTKVTSGRRWTIRASPAKKPDSAASPYRAIRRAARFDGRIRRRARPIRAAVKVSETSIATSAIDTPAAPSADSPGMPNISRPHMAAATVRALNRMVRPAVAQARAIATAGSYPRPSSSRYRPTSSSP